MAEEEHQGRLSSRMLSRWHWGRRAAGGGEDFKGLPYMYRIENAQGDPVYRTDIFSRSQIGSVNVFGQKLLREWSRTLRMIRPTVMLIAEDHTGWDAVTKPPAQGGLGFDALRLVLALGGHPHVFSWAKK